MKTKALAVLLVLGTTHLVVGAQPVARPVTTPAYPWPRLGQILLDGPWELAFGQPPPAGKLPEKLDKLSGLTRELEREVQRLQGRLAAGSLEQVLGQAQVVEGIRVVAANPARAYNPLFLYGGANPWAGRQCEANRLLDTVDNQFGHLPLVTDPGIFDVRIDFQRYFRVYPQLPVNLGYFVEKLLGNSRPE